MVSRKFLTLFASFSETVFDVVNQETDKMELKKGTRINMSHIGRSEDILTSIFDEGMLLSFSVRVNFVLQKIQLCHIKKRFAISALCVHSIKSK